jgi:hypothetical protein
MILNITRIASMLVIVAGVLSTVNAQTPCTSRVF